MKNIDWNRVADALSVPFTFAVCYSTAEAGMIAAIALGATDSYNLLKIGWVIGLLCGAVAAYFIAVRPKNKLIKDYSDLTSDLLGLVKGYDEALHEAKRKHHVEGDEWKEQDLIP